MEKVNGKVSSIKLVKLGNGVTWKVTILGENNEIIGVLYDEQLCNSINFRTQTYGILQAIGENNLLMLDGQSKKYPICIDTYPGMCRISCIANKSGDYISMDKDTAAISTGTGLDVSNFEDGVIEGISSSSLCLSASTTRDFIGQSVIYTHVYNGFTPLYSKNVSEEEVQKSSDNFKTVVCSLLKICNLDELIQSDVYPNISVILDDNNKIAAIGNGEDYLSISENGYSIVDSRQFDVERTR